MAEPASTAGDRPRGGSAERWQALAIVSWIAAMTILVVGFVLWARSGFGPLPQLFMTPLGFATLALLVVTQATAGLILVVRRPDNRIGLIILAFALVVSPAELANGYIALAESGAPVPADPAAVGVVLSAIAFAGGTLIAEVLGLVFPTGRLISPRWSIAIAIAIAGSVAMGLALALTPGPLLLLPDIDNPIPDAGTPSWLPAVRDIVGPLLITIGAVGSGAALIVRYTRADGIGRLQLRWYIAAGVVLAIGFVAFVGAMLSLPSDSRAGQVVVILFYLAGCLPPVALVFAILRYRLYDIDRILGRTFVYGALTAILAGLYTASVRLFNALFVDLTGESSEVALVITTLILATTFTPIKRRLEAIVDRWMRPAGRPVELAPEAAAAIKPAALFDDPAFVAAFASEVETILDRRSDTGATAESAHPSGDPAGGRDIPGADGGREAQGEDGADGDRATSEGLEL